MSFKTTDVNDKTLLQQALEKEVCNEFYVGIRRWLHCDLARPCLSMAAAALRVTCKRGRF